MHTTKTLAIALTLFIGLVCPPAGAHAEQAPVWVAYDRNTMPDWQAPFALNKRQSVKLGDPRLGAWAVEQIKQIGTMREYELIAWLRVVELYRVTEAESVVLGAISKLEPEQDTELTRQLYATATQVTTAKNSDKLAKLLKTLADTKLTKDQRDRDEQMARLAAALIRLDAKAGRDYMIECIGDYVDTDTPTNRDAYRAVIRELGAIGDQELHDLLSKMHKLPALKKIERDLEDTIEDMARNARPVDEQWKIIEDEESPRSERWALVPVLAERGDMEGIARIQKINLTAGGRVDARTVARALELRDGAVQLMRCRLWRELVKP